MQKLKYINPNNEELDLTSGHFGITNWSGLSEVPLNVQSQTVPFQDGAVFLDALLQQRDIALTVAINDEGDLSRRYEYRRELISKLNPKLGEGFLIYENDYISKRIKCIPQLPTIPNKNIDESGTLKASLTFTAENPYWEDLEETTVNFTINDNIEIENKGDIAINPIVEVFNFGTQNNDINILINEESKLKIQSEKKNILVTTTTGEKTVNGFDQSFNFLLANSQPYAVCFIPGKNRTIYAFYGFTVIKENNEYKLKDYSLVVNYDSEFFYVEKWEKVFFRNNSKVYVSDDYGETFTNISSEINAQFIYNAYYSEKLDKVIYAVKKVDDTQSLYVYDNFGNKTEIMLKVNSQPFTTLSMAYIANDTLIVSDFNDITYKGTITDNQEINLQQLENSPRIPFSIYISNKDEDFVVANEQDLYILKNSSWEKKENIFAQGVNAIKYIKEYNVYITLSNHYVYFVSADFKIVNKGIDFDRYINAIDFDSVKNKIIIGLNYLSYNGKTKIYPDLNNENITSIAEKNDNIYISTTNGIYKFNLKNKSLIKLLTGNFKKIIDCENCFYANTSNKVYFSENGNDWINVPLPTQITNINNIVYLTNVVFVLGNYSYVIGSPLKYDLGFFINFPDLIDVVFDKTQPFYRYFYLRNNSKILYYAKEFFHTPSVFLEMPETLKSFIYFEKTNQYIFTSAESNKIFYISRITSADIITVSLSEENVKNLINKDEYFILFNSNGNVSKSVSTEYVDSFEEYPFQNLIYFNNKYAVTTKAIYQISDGDYENLIDKIEGSLSLSLKQGINNISIFNKSKNCLMQVKYRNKYIGL